MLSAQEALAWGILNGVMAPERFPDEVYAMARQLAQGPTLAYARAKKLVLYQSERIPRNPDGTRGDDMADSGKTEDFREGIMAFMEKRPPIFRGK